MMKRSKSSGWDVKPPSSFQSPAKHSEWNRAQEKEDYRISLKDRFEGSSSGHHSTGRHGWGPPLGDTNRSSMLGADCKLYVSSREPSNCEQRRIRREYSQHLSPLRSVPLPDWGNTNTRHHRPKFDSGPSRSHPGQRIRSNEVLPVEVPRLSEWESIDQSGGDGPDWSCISPVQRSSGPSERVRSNEAQPTMVEVPRASEWETIVQSKDDGPDWSCISPVQRSCGPSKKIRSSEVFPTIVEVPRLSKRESTMQSGDEWSCISPVLRSSGPSERIRSKETLPTMLEFPRSSEWESIGQSVPRSVLYLPSPRGPGKRIRSNEALPTMVEVPRSSKQESSVQSGDDGPDWDCISPVRKSSGPSERVRSNGGQATLVEVPRASEWKTNLQSKDDGPDWSRISPVQRSSCPKRMNEKH